MNVRWLRPHRGLVVSLVAALLTVVGLLTVIVVRQQQDSDTGNGQVYLEEAGGAGAHPFVPLSPNTPTAAAGDVGGGGVATPESPGADNVATYNSDGLISYLGSHPEEAATWVQALNSDSNLAWSGGSHIETWQIPAYIHGLTLRVLAVDVRVTDYQFVNGGAVATQSILQKGTIVLVDAEGVLRVRCASGNPLTPMIQLRTQPVYVGTPWPHFQPPRIVVVKPGPRGVYPERPRGSVAPSVVYPAESPKSVAPAVVYPAEPPKSVAPPVVYPTRSPKSVAPPVVYPARPPAPVPPPVVYPARPPAPVPPPVVYPAQPPPPVTTTEPNFGGPIRK